MSIPVKNRWVGARADEDLATRVADYVEATHTNMGEMVRAAVEAYMKLYPASVKEKAKV